MSTPLPLIIVEPDPALAHEVDAIAAQLAEPTESIAVADLTEVADWFDDACVVVAGPSSSGKTEIAALAEFHEEYPTARIVLAWSKRPGGTMRDVVAIGADALVDPTDEDDLASAVTRSIHMAARSRPAPAALAVIEEKPLGQVYTVASATGGCGKTFFSTNLAFALNQLSSKSVCLVDLDLQFGEVLTALRIRARHTMADAVAIADDAELTSFLPEMMTKHESGVDVLPAPLDPAEADSIQPPDVLRIIDALRHTYDYVIVDNPTGLGETTLAALDRSSHLFVLAALDLSSVRNLRLFLQTLERLQIGDSEVSLVLNKDQKGVGIDADDIEQLFPRGFQSKIPFDRDVPRSMNNGTPVIEAYPDSPVSAELLRGVVPFLPEEEQAAAAARSAPPARQPFFRRLFSRRDVATTPTTGS